MIYSEMPVGFNPKFEVVSCFFEYKGEILLLHRQSHKPQGNTWGIPAGKIDEGEQISDAILRELKEETGFNALKEGVSYHGKVFVRYPTYDFLYHTFHAELGDKFVVRINPNEHQDFRWIFPKRALDLPLIQDMDSCIKMFYKI